MDKKLNQNTFCNTKHKRVKYKKITFKKIKCSEYIIINFNPWFFSNQSNLYVQFFKVLINNITNHEYNKIPLLKRTTDYQKSLFKKLRIETLEEYLHYLELNKSDLFYVQAVWIYWDDSLAFLDFDFEILDPRIYF